MIEEHFLPTFGSVLVMLYEVDDGEHITGSLATYAISGLMPWAKCKMDEWAT